MIKDIMRSPAFSVVLFVAAAALLLGGTVGAVQAAPRIQSNWYNAEVVLTDIETALTERTGNETVFNEREGDDDLLTTFLDANGDDELKIGKTYPYELGVRNVANRGDNPIAQYVRVTVNKYWVLTDSEGNAISDKTGKQVTLDPSLIDLHFVEGNGWTIDKDSSTPERTVLYYSGILEPGEDSTPFTDTLTIDGKVVTSVTQLSDGIKFDYEGVQFRIKASVDAVQTHNADDAMTSAWGRTNKG